MNNALDKIEKGLQRAAQNEVNIELTPSSMHLKQEKQLDAPFAELNKVDVTQQVSENVLNASMIDDAKKEASVAQLATYRSLPKPPGFERTASSFTTNSL